MTGGPPPVRPRTPRLDGLYRRRQQRPSSSTILWDIAQNCVATVVATSVAALAHTFTLHTILWGAVLAATVCLGLPLGTGPAAESRPLRQAVSTPVGTGTAVPMPPATATAVPVLSATATAVPVLPATPPQTTSVPSTGPQQTEGTPTLPAYVPPATKTKVPFAPTRLPVVTQSPVSETVQTAGSTANLLFPLLWLFGGLILIAWGGQLLIKYLR